MEVDEGKVGDLLLYCMVVEGLPSKYLFEY
jgi:hypothetical protein